MNNGPMTAFWRKADPWLKYRREKKFASRNRLNLF